MNDHAERALCNAVAIATNDAIPLTIWKATQNQTNTQIEYAADSSTDAETYNVTGTFQFPKKLLKQLTKPLITQFPKNCLN